MHTTQQVHAAFNVAMTPFYQTELSGVFGHAIGKTAARNGESHRAGARWDRGYSPARMGSEIFWNLFFACFV